MDKYVKQFNIKNSLAVQNFCLLHWRRGAQKYNHILAFLKDEKWITRGYQAMLFATLEMMKKVMGDFWDCYKRLGLLAW